MNGNSQDPNLLISFAETMGLIINEKEELKKQFNPNNEPIHVLKVIQKKDAKRLRPWIGAMQIDKKRTEEYGSPQYERVPPTPQSHQLTEKDKKISGPHDEINYMDPDIIDPETDLPVWRIFKKGEVFLAVDVNASWMLKQEFAIPMPEFKNAIIEETGKLHFDWAEENEIISSKESILIPKYHERYSRNATAVMTLADRLLSAEMEIAALKKQQREKAGV